MGACNLDRPFFKPRPPQLSKMGECVRKKSKFKLAAPTNIWPSSPHLSRGTNMKVEICLVVQHESWNVAVLTLSHVECCVTMSIEFLQNMN